jgi:hypothetical protein
MTNRDELRQKMAIVIADALGEGIHYQRPGFQRAADAAIAAYEAHRPRPDVVLTLEEWAKARSIFVSEFWSKPFSVAIFAAFPFIKVEGE